MLRDTSTSFELTNVRAVGDDHAFADCVVLAVHNAALMRRDADNWLFVDARPYTYASIPD